MLISARQLHRFWNVSPGSMLHVGAHEAEEEGDYRRLGWGPVVWVEALPDKADALSNRFSGDPGNRVYRGVAWDADGDRIAFNVADNGQSSSAFRFDTHELEHPEIRHVGQIEVITTRLDTLLADERERFDMVCLDIQGAELRALTGLGDRLAAARWIYCEVNTEPLYDGIALFPEITDFLDSQGFRLADWRITGHGWGDALYVRAGLVPRLPRLRRAMRRVDTLAHPLTRRLGRRAAA